ncbi:hypothetical protein EMWEY_00029260 [Eimeria maxima]|uniref:Apple domain-containing protein n=1 Tax=Eimeria maxima TaxID=5804 RepID=U6LYQ2_EIMMA|nr:hypothetical protein EMWEY_00029260 [Eimeria maxima]CDJ57062.1 hypothetical protein EMWEY_00029260 [Eimeria maxima]
MRHLQRVAALAGLGVAVWPKESSAWLAPSRRHNGSATGNFDAPISMLESQWGSPYTEIEVLKSADALDFVFSRVLGDTDADLLPAIEYEEMAKQEGGLSPEDKEAFACNLTGYTMNGDTGLYQTVRGLEVDTDCQQMCGQVQGCILATFDGSNCKMYSSVGTIEEGRGSIVIQGCDNSCYRRGQRHKGEGISLGKALNPHVCQAICRGKEDCIGFSWERSTLECTSYTKEDDYTPSRGYVSGPRDLCTLNTKPANYAGNISLANYSGNANNDVETANVASEELCRRMCLLSPTCNWVTYNTADYKCYQKSAKGVIVKAKEGDRTSSRLADSSCYLKDVKYTADPYTTNQKEYLQECVHACSVDNRCNRWTYNTQNKNCQLFDGEGPYTSDYNALNTWSGPSSGCAAEPIYLTQPDAPACSIRGVRYGGFPINSVVSNNANECQSACDSATGCEAFSYDFIGKVCYFYIAINAQTKIPNYNFISGPRQCAGCQEGAVEYSGAIKEIASGVETPEECQLICQATAHCSRYTFRGNRCSLFNSQATSEPSPMAISGPRYCTGACDLNGYFAPMKDYGYMQQRETETKEECRALCKKDPKCSNFTHWEDKRCYLKDDESLRHVGVPKESASTGFLSCGSCLAEGVGIKVDNTNLLWRLEAYNGEECRWRCDIMSSCARFVYNVLTRECTLLKGDATKTNSSELISGPSRCTVDNSCYINNRIIEGGEKIKSAETNTAEACQELCIRNAKCTHFSYNNNNNNGQCTLLAGKLTTREEEGIISGPKKCFALKSLCNENSITYEGGEINNSAVDTVEECQKVCELKSKIKEIKEDTNAVSGPRRC